MYIVMNNGIPEKGFYQYEDALEYVRISHLSKDDIHLIDID